MNKLFPVILIALQFLACIGYAVSKDYKMAIYWLSAGVLNICVTF